MESMNTIPYPVQAPVSNETFLGGWLAGMNRDELRRQALEDQARQTFNAMQLQDAHYKALSEIEKQRDARAIASGIASEHRALAVEKSRAEHQLALKQKEEDFAAMKSLYEKARRYGVSVKGSDGIVKSEDEINSAISKAASGEVKRLKSAIDQNNKRAESAFSAPDVSRIANQAVQNVIRNPAIRGALSPQAVAELDKVKDSQGAGLLLSRLKNERGHWLGGVGNKADASALDSAIAAEMASLSQTAQTRDTQIGLSALKEIADSNKVLYDQYAKHLGMLNEADQTGLLIGDQDGASNIPKSATDPLAGFAAKKLSDEMNPAFGLPRTYAELPGQGTGEADLPVAAVPDSMRGFVPPQIALPVRAGVAAASAIAPAIAASLSDPQGRYAGMVSGVGNAWNLAFPQLPPPYRGNITPAGVPQGVFPVAPMTPAGINQGGYGFPMTPAGVPQGYSLYGGQDIQLPGGPLRLNTLQIPSQFQRGIAPPMTPAGVNQYFPVQQ